MNVKKAVKRIAALAAGTTMVTATIMGAMAYDLGDFPEPFVKSGVFGGKIVFGRTAQVSDVYGAVDIAASLQAAAVTPVDASGSAIVSVEGGIELSSSSTDLHYADAISALNSGAYDAEDFPEMLADGTVEDDDGTEYDYEQSIEVSDAVIGYGQDDDYGNDPVFYIDLDVGADDNFYLKVDFTDTLDVTELEDSETIEMFGKVYTFDPNHGATDDLTLYGSDLTVFINQGEPVTVEVNGEEYTLEVLGGNSDAGTVNLRVTGDGTSTKSLEEGDSRKMAGLDLFVDDVFISNIGGDDISVSVFVGSEKIIIPNDAADAACAAAGDYEEITIGTDDETDIHACMVATNLTDIDGIYFRVDPSVFDNPAIDDEWNWLVMGEEYELPLFDFAVSFDSFTPSVESRPIVELTRKTDTYELAFTNNNGKDITIELVMTDDGADLMYGYDGNLNGAMVAAGDEIAEDEYFILQSDASDADDIVTYVFEVTDVDNDDDEVTIKELGTGSSKTLGLGKEILDTNVFVDDVTATGFNLTDDTVDWIIAKGGLNISWDDTNLTTGSAGWLELSFAEETDDLDDVASVSTLKANITAAGTDDIDMGNAAWISAVSTTTVGDTDGDVLYGISEYGTWFEQDTDDESDWARVYYANEETDFHVFLNGPDAVVVTSGSSGNAYMLNEFVVGQIAVYDDEAAGLVGKTPLIVVGGPCVNTVAMTLLGNPESACTAGFTDGKGKIKYFDSKLALLVAGYSGEDTTGAARIVAEAAYGKRALSGSEVEVIVTDLAHLTVQEIA